MAVVGHRPPAEPLLQHRLRQRLVQVAAGAVAEELQALGVQGRVVAGELHRRAEAVARPHRRDGDVVLLEQERIRRAPRGARHGDRVALARLDGHLAAELPVQERRPGAGRDHERVRGDLASRRDRGAGGARGGYEAPDLAVLADGDAAAFEHAPPLRQEAVGAQVGIGREVPAAGEPGLEGRLAFGERGAVDALGGKAERVAQEGDGFGVVLHRRAGAEDEEDAARLPLAVDRLVAHQTVVERPRRVQERLDTPTGREHVRAVAAGGKAQEPAPQRRVAPRPHGKGRVALEQRPQRRPGRAGRRQRQDVAGGDEAAVGVRAARAVAPLVEERDPPAGLREVVGAGRADDAPADHDDGPGAHPRIPIANGSSGSSSSVASALT